MSKKSFFQGSFIKQHSKCAQTFLKCQGQLFYHIYWSLLRQLSHKKSLLLICKIWRLFINTLSADGEYYLFNRDNLTEPIHMQVYRKQKTFSRFFSAFLKSSLNFKHFEKKRMTLIAEVFPKLRTTKNMVTSMYKKSRFKGSSGKQDGKRLQTLLKFAWQPLLYSLQVPRKQKTFSEFFSPFFKSNLNFEHFQKKKMSLIAHVFPKLRTQKNLVWSMPKKYRFKGSFKKQHGKLAQTLLKCQWQLLYHIYWSLLRQLSYKKYLLVIRKILRLFPKTLSVKEKYSLVNRDNFTQRIEMQVSPKQKTFSHFFSGFLRASLNLKYFETKDDSHSCGISKITKSKSQG